MEFRAGIRTNQVNKLITLFFIPKRFCGWSGGAMALGKLPVPGHPTIWMIVGQGPTALAGGTGGGCMYIFTLLYLFSPLSPSLWKTARHRLKYCIKGPLNPKQPANPTGSHKPKCIYLLIFQSKCSSLKVTLQYAVAFHTSPNKH